MSEDEETLGHDEARPCPFCGSMPTIQPWHGGPPTKRMIMCVDMSDDVECHVQPSVCGVTRSEALERWNARSA